MARDWEKLATEVVDLVGGEANITSVMHCVTRLRFKLRDESLADDEKVGAVDGVIQVMHAAGQYQVVIGPKVGDAYDAVIKLLPDKATGEVPADEEDAPAEKLKPVDRMIDIVSGVFMPILGCIAGAGMLKALVVTFSTFGLLDASSSTYAILNMMGDGVFQFIPILLGYSAAKKLGSSPMLGVAIGAFLCHPGLSTLVADYEEVGGPTLFGIPVTMPMGGYLSSVIPIILACALLAPVEKFFNRIIPEVVRGVLAPVFSLLVTCSVILLVIGPVSSAASAAVANGLVALLDAAPVIGGFVIAALYPILIIFGLHWGLLPVVMNNLATLGYDMITPIIVGTNYAVGGALLGVFLKTKKAGLKSTAMECLVPAWIAGVTEPGVYGVLLKYKRTFACMCIGCGVAGAIGGIMGLKQTMFLSATLLMLPALYGVVGIWALVQVAASIVVAFIMTYIFGYNDKMEAE